MTTTGSRLRLLLPGQTKPDKHVFCIHNDFSSSSRLSLLFLFLDCSQGWTMRGYLIINLNLFFFCLLLLFWLYDNLRISFFFLNKNKLESFHHHHHVGLYTCLHTPTHAQSDDNDETCLPATFGCWQQQRGEKRPCWCLRPLTEWKSLVITLAHTHADVKTRF